MVLPPGDVYIMPPIPYTPTDPGIVAFDAFHASLGHGSTAQNWQALPGEIRAAWNAAAAAVRLRQVNP